MSTSSNIPFALSGTGNAVDEQVIVQAKRNGRVRRIVARSTGGATAALFFLVQNNRTGVTAPTTEPDENVVVETDSVDLTASAHANSLDSPVSAEPTFQNGLTLVASVTASGAWTLVGYIEVSV